MSVRETVRNSRVTERLLEELQKIAPYTDEYDVAFGAVLLVILGIGILDRFLNGSDFLNGSETLALITASTAFIALYRLRHSHEKRRPTARPDYDPPDGNTPCDFGLRSYGPGPVRLSTFKRFWRSERTRNPSVPRSGRVTGPSVPPSSFPITDHYISTKGSSSGCSIRSKTTGSKSSVGRGPKTRTRRATSR
jgi:hypothetical protein